MPSYHVGWTGTCILEQLLIDEQKTEHLVEVLTRLGLKIKTYNDRGGFHIVEKKG